MVARLAQESTAVAGTCKSQVAAYAGRVGWVSLLRTDQVEADMKARWIAVILLSLFVPTLGTVPASAGLIVWHRYVNKNSSYCLAVSGNSPTDGAKLIVWRCSSAGQAWRHAGDTTWANFMEGSGKCMSIPNGSTTAGVQAIQWTCGSSAERLWNDDGITLEDYGTIVNYKSRMCLAVTGGSKVEGAAVIQWPCNNGPEQQWKMLMMNS
jgi:ricin-type beta-trefoil lectin protein